MKARRLTTTDHEQLHREAMANRRAAIETKMAIPALAKESYHHQQVANLETMKTMMRCGVKVLAEPVAECAVPVPVTVRGVQP
jgi:hypothetical protein